jgi:DNA-binding response OmpR family regulator
MLPHVLLVDADGALVGLQSQLLQSAGYAVTLSASFEEAGARLKEQEFHAVVAAHHLGKHNGLHLILRARARRPAVLAVITSPVADPVLIAEAGALGAACVVAPWVDPSELLRLLQAGAQPA